MLWTVLTELETRTLPKDAVRYTPPQGSSASSGSFQNYQGLTAPKKPTERSLAEELGALEDGEFAVAFRRL
ncbi:hypothetical protein MRY87_11405, partial [bacterium]|nr:hypothetical protein [bacterium]